MQAVSQAGKKADRQVDKHMGARRRSEYKRAAGKAEQGDVRLNLESRQGALQAGHEGEDAKPGHGIKRFTHANLWQSIQLQSRINHRCRV